MAALLLAASVFAQAVPDLGYTTRVGAGLAAHYTRKFGPPTPERLAQWIGFAKEQKRRTFMLRMDADKARGADALQSVNDAINEQVKWFEDKVHWGVEDYWATPAESVATAGGDCEDYSIAKYYLLKELGVPLERLRITYVRALSLNGQAHMVLVYYAKPDAEPLILDNIDRRVRAASQRPDLDRNSVAIVHRLLPAYIKLAPAFTQQIGEREDLRFIVESLVRILRPLEIPLIAQGVEDAGTVAVLAELGLAGYQGYAGGRPEPLA